MSLAMEIVTTREETLRQQRRTRRTVENMDYEATRIAKAKREQELWDEIVNEAFNCAKWFAENDYEDGIPMPVLVGTTWLRRRPKTTIQVLWRISAYVQNHRLYVSETGELHAKSWLLGEPPRYAYRLLAFPEIDRTQVDPLARTSVIEDLEKLLKSLKQRSFE